MRARCKTVRYGVGNRRLRSSIAVVISAAVLGAALFVGLGSSSASAPTSASAACAAARTKIAGTWPDSGQLNCRKAEIIAAAFPRGGSVAAPKVARIEPTPPAPPPTNDGVIRTADIEQSAVPGTSIATLWMDLEDGMYVQVQSGNEISDPSQGTIDITVINPDGYVINSQGEPVPQTTGTVNGYAGGEYSVPGEPGSITLTAITGSLATNDMLISFAYANGTGSFDPQTGSFALGGDSRSGALTKGTP